MPVSPAWLSELDQKIQDRQVRQNESFQCNQNKLTESKKKYYCCAAAIVLLTLIVIAVCLATIDYNWDDEEEVKHNHKDSVNLSVKVDMSPERPALQPVEMIAPEGVHRDMGFDHPGAQYFAGPVKVMSDEERIRYERMMHPVPTTFQEFMDNQKFVFHVMDFSNLMPPPPVSQQSASGTPLHQNQNEDDDEDEDENPETDEVLRSIPTAWSQDGSGMRSIPSDFLTQQYLASLKLRKSQQSKRWEDFSDSSNQPHPRRGHTGQLPAQAIRPAMRGRSDAIPDERSFYLNQLKQKQAAPLPLKEKNLDDLFVQADRNIEEITQMKQTASFLMTAIGRMLVQKAQMQQNLQKKSASVAEETATKKGPEEKAAMSVDSERKLDHLLDVADQDIVKLSQKTNQTDKLMDLISEMLSASLSSERKQEKAKTLEEEEAPSRQQQLHNGDNFPFLPFFSPISIQRKEHGGQPFGTEKPGYLFLGEPMVGPADEEIESSTGVLADSKVLPPYSLLQPPSYSGKPLDDQSDDPESGDVVGDEEDDEADAQTLTPDTSESSKSAEHVPAKVMVREKRISRPGMFRMGRND